ncbi:MAG: hypothetical protein Q4B71_00190 [Cardiobacteriaceae bacterium]|nr:hypothetical protein [Cardiobacteriaceae bacterium]
MTHHYTITPSQSGHFFNITLKLSLEAGEHECWLPVWIPGSYCRRDYSKHITELSAKQGQSALTIRYVTASRWAISVPKAGEITVSYRVYGRDVSVRGNYLDHERAMVNPCPTCIVFDEHQPVIIRFDLQGKHQGWGISGAVAEADGSYHFENHDEAADTPFMLGKALCHHSFVLGGIVHDFYFTGVNEDDDLERLMKDTEIMCQSALEMFGAFPKAVKRYQFMLHLTGSTRGGLEHRQSTLLMERNSSVPKIGQSALPERYLDLAGLIIHEYFHTWNVKDLKAKTHQPYRMEAEQYDDLLWFFEGYTAYFDNYLMLKSGVISPQAYIDMIASDHSRHLPHTGRFRQTLAQSSIEAWTKYYNPNEIGAQLSTSYYVQGSLAALCTDIWLFKHGLRLEDVVAHIWKQYDKTQQGLTEARYFEWAREVLPQELWEGFEALVGGFIHSTQPLPMQSALAEVGCVVEYQAKYAVDFGFDTKNGMVALIDEHSSAAHAGLANGDKLVNINGEAWESRNWQGDASAEYQVGQAIALEVTRDGKPFTFHFTTQAPREDKVLYRFEGEISPFFKPQERLCKR